MPVDPMVGRERAGGRRAAAAPLGPTSLAPPWATAVAVAALLVTAVLSGLVWHSTRLPGPDGWVLHLLGAHSGEWQFGLATGLAAALAAFTIVGIATTALGAWMALRRWNAVALVVLAPAVTLVADKLLKPLVARRAPGSAAFHYPSGHVAVLTALALCLVLIVRSAMARPRVKLLVGLSAALLVILMALARLVETAHLLTDVVSGVSMAAAVTLGAALLLDRRGRSVRYSGARGTAPAILADEFALTLEAPPAPVDPPSRLAARPSRRDAKRP